MEVLIAPGERHTYVNEHPFSANAVKTFAAVVAFIRKHAGQQVAAR